MQHRTAVGEPNNQQKRDLLEMSICVSCWDASIFDTGRKKREPQENESMIEEPTVYYWLATIGASLMSVYAFAKRTMIRTAVLAARNISYVEFEVLIDRVRYLHSKYRKGQEITDQDLYNLGRLVYNAVKDGE